MTLMFLSYCTQEHTGCIKTLSSPQSCSESVFVIDVNEVTKAHRNITPNLSAHAITGCDTVSSLPGIGKATVLKKAAVFQWLDEACSCVGTEERDHRFVSSVHSNDVPL